MRIKSRKEESILLRVVGWIICFLLWEMYCLAEIVLVFHHVGEAFMRNVEKIDERLDISSLEKMSANRLSCIVLMVVRRSDCRYWLIFGEFI